MFYLLHFPYFKLEGGSLLWYDGSTSQRTLNQRTSLPVDDRSRKLTPLKQKAANQDQPSTYKIFPAIHAQQAEAGRVQQTKVANWSKKHSLPRNRWLSVFPIFLIFTGSHQFKSSSGYLRHSDWRIGVRFPIKPIGSVDRVWFSKSCYKHLSEDNKHLELESSTTNDGIISSKYPLNSF